MSLLLRAALALADWRYRRPMLAAARDPRGAQEATLRRILKANAATEFGRAHGFAEIRNLAAFRAAVPVQTHDSLAPAIRRQAETGAPALTAQPPVCYARTSGTTAPARDFPVTEAGRAAQISAQRIFAATLARDTGFFAGRIAGLGGAAVEGHLPSGQPFGAASGQTYATAPKFIRDRFVVPEHVFAMTDAEAKYRAYAEAMAAALDLSGIITANPSTLLTVLARLDRPAAELWPRLNTLATWTGGNCRAALDRLLPLLPDNVRVVEIGYRASEVVGTVNVDAVRNLCLPDLTHSVFEFVPEDAWEAGRPDFLSLDELEDGQRYYVFVTTPSGLYRYDINDVLQVTGWLAGCPALGFRRKGQGVTSITGEKLHEDQALAAIRAAETAEGLAPAFFLLVADAAAGHYQLYYEGDSPEAFAVAVDRELQRTNIEYAAKRASDRLGTVTVTCLRTGAGEAMKQAAIAAGQREAQVKPPVLVDAGRLSFDLAPWCVPC